MQFSLLMGGDCSLIYMLIAQVSAPVLLGGALDSPFISYNKSLFTDRAIVASVPNAGRLRPYTLAETMNHGWCWNIPTVEEDHRGYVFSSAFATVEEAAEEMRQRNPKMGDYFTVKFVSGRHDDFWKGNVVAIGNSYAFVEPLESTALHMAILQIEHLLEALPVRKHERGVQAALNRKVGDHWDYVRWFLALHYRFNNRLNTPFWQASRSDVDVSAYAELLDWFRERGPLSCTGANKLRVPDNLWADRSRHYPARAADCFACTEAQEPSGSLEATCKYRTRHCL